MKLLISAFFLIQSAFVFAIDSDLVGIWKQKSTDFTVETHLVINEDGSYHFFENGQLFFSGKNFEEEIVQNTEEQGAIFVTTLSKNGEDFSINDAITYDGETSYTVRNFEKESEGMEAIEMLGYAHRRNVAGNFKGIGFFYENKELGINSAIEYFCSQDDFEFMSESSTSGEIHVRDNLTGERSAEVIIEGESQDLGRDFEFVFNLKNIEITKSGECVLNDKYKSQCVVNNHTNTIIFFTPQKLEDGTIVENVFLATYQYKIVNGVLELSYPGVNEGELQVLKFNKDKESLEKMVYCADKIEETERLNKERQHLEINDSLTIKEVIRDDSLNEENIRNSVAR